METTTQAKSQVKYSTEEIAILQRHLDWYRNLPELSSLQGFSLEHRVPGDREACKSLASKGLVESYPVQAKERRECIRVKSEAEGALAIRERLGTLNNVSMSQAQEPFKYWTFSWVDFVLLPGECASVTDRGAKEIVRLYKDGVLKRHD